MKLPKFLTGLLIGTAISLVIWYWQKSTSAEEGALAVLDRLAAAEARVRDLEGKLRVAREQGYPSESPEVLSGLPHLWGLEASDSQTVPETILTADPAEIDSTAVVDQSGDDLKQINGIGPTYERRLKAAGVRTFEDLARQSPEDIASLLGQRSLRLADPEEWIAEAKNLSEA